MFGKFGPEAPAAEIDQERSPPLNEAQARAPKILPSLIRLAREQERIESAGQGAPCSEARAERLDRKAAKEHGRPASGAFARASGGPAPARTCGDADRDGSCLAGEAQTCPERPQASTFRAMEGAAAPEGVLATPQIDLRQRGPQAARKALAQPACAVPPASVDLSANGAKPHIRDGMELAPSPRHSGEREPQVSELDRALVIGRATYERWLGTEPAEIVAAAEALRRMDAKHPTLRELEIRLRHARRLKAMLCRAALSAERARQDPHR